jgi:hypothetical protein
VRLAHALDAVRPRLLLLASARGLADVHDHGVLLAVPELLAPRLLGRASRCLPHEPPDLAAVTGHHRERSIIRVHFLFSFFLLFSFFFFLFFLEFFLFLKGCEKKKRNAPPVPKKTETDGAPFFLGIFFSLSLAYKQGTQERQKGISGLKKEPGTKHTKK